MAAYAVAMRAAYVRLGFTQEAALLITDDQGLIELEEIRLMTDPEVVNLCKVLRRPGGTMMVPNAAGVNVQVPNPGNKVSLLAENNLKMECFLLEAPCSCVACGGSRRHYARECEKHSGALYIRREARGSKRQADHR